MKVTPAAGAPTSSGAIAFAALTLGLAGVCTAAYLQADGALDTVRWIGRWTIRSAVVLFAMAFTAPALAKLFAGRLTAWLLNNRPVIVLAFVFSFGLHLSAIARFFALDQHLFWSVSPVFLIVLRSIGVAFMVLVALVATGLLRGVASRSSAIFGEYYVLGAFLAGFAKRIPLDRFYVAPVALLLLALGVRVIAMFVRNERR